MAATNFVTESDNMVKITSDNLRYANMSADYFRIYKLIYPSRSITIAMSGFTIGVNDGGYANRASITFIYTLYNTSHQILYKINLNHNTNSISFIDSNIRGSYPSITSYELIPQEDIVEFLLNEYTSFHSDPVYIEATKLKYTDGTYNFARGAKTADQARQAAYNSLLKSYGTFYKGTEREMLDSFVQVLGD